MLWQVVKEVQQMLVSGLESCGEQECRGMYLRALGNAGLPNTVTVLLQHAETPKVPMLAFTAINALRRIHKQFISDEVSLFGYSFAWVNDFIVPVLFLCSVVTFFFFYSDNRFCHPDFECFFK